MSSRHDIKEQVSDKIPKRFKELKFGIQSIQQITKQGVLEVSDRSVQIARRNICAKSIWTGERIANVG